LGVKSPTCYSAEHRIWLACGVNHAPYECPCDYRDRSKDQEWKFFFEKIGTVLLQQSNEKYDVSNSEQNLNCRKRQSPFHKAGER
jgi:hypothetical protein